MSDNVNSLFTVHGTVGPGGAAILDSNNNFVATGERLPEGTIVQGGMHFIGSWDDDGKQLLDRFRYVEVLTPDGLEVWVDRNELVSNFASK